MAVASILLRFANHTNGCCILLGPELCQNTAFWRSFNGNLFCAAHATSNFKQYNAQKEQPTCDMCLPRICCTNIPVWIYEEVGGRQKLLCEQHGQDFKSIRPPFEESRPKGYSAKRIGDKK